MVELQGTSFGYYELQSRLARGGMSEIYLALDTRTQRTVAIKVVNRSQEEYIRRFQREIQALELLEHQHILPTYEYGEDGAWCYFVMPYIEHGTLRDKIAQGPIPQKEAGVILEQIAGALQCAHDHGILHRDIKPSNILLRDETHMYLADFGLAKGMTDSHDITQAGFLIGTPDYMAPELMEKPATASSDIYAVGVLLYQMLTGQVPFKGKSPLDVYWKHIKEQPRRPSSINPAISPAVEQVVLCAMEKGPENRFSSVQEMAQAYRRALIVSVEDAQAEVPETLSNLAIGPVMQRIIPWAARERRRRPSALIVVVAVLFFLLIPAVLAFSITQNNAASQASTTTAYGVSIAISHPAEVVQHRPASSAATGTQSNFYHLPSQSTPAESGGGDGGHVQKHHHRHGH